MTIVMKSDVKGEAIKAKHIIIILYYFLDINRKMKIYLPGSDYSSSRAVGAAKSFRLYCNAFWVRSISKIPGSHVPEKESF